MSKGLDAKVEVTVGDFRLAAALTAQPGETVAVIGPNGAGKTTLVRAIAGLVPLTAGRVSLDGDMLEDSSTGSWVPPERRRIGVVFQDNVLFPNLSALDNVAFGLRAQGRSRSEARQLAVDWLGRFDLSDRGSARPSELSGGQAQRVAVARALATEPALLLLDEPFSALDVAARGELRRQLRHHLASLNVPRVIVTHDPLDAAAIADRLVVIEEGKIVQEGSVEEMTARPRSRYIAEFVGTNLLRGTARATTVVMGTSEVITSTAAEGDVFLSIPPRAVVLSREQPETSARNAWPGKVESVERQRDVVRVRVRGAVDLVAEVTVTSADALGLSAGAPIWMSVKATEITVTA